MKSNFEALQRKRGRPKKSDSSEITETTEISETGEPSEPRGTLDLAELRAIAEAADLEAALEEKHIPEEAYDQLLLSSKGGMDYPWLGMDPKEVRKLQRPLRFNHYEKALLHYVAGTEQLTVNKWILKVAKKSALAKVRRKER